MIYRWVGIGLLLVPVLAWAQTMYVKDGNRASVYTGLLQQPPVIASLKAGSEVEILQRIEDDYKVRLADGQEGFISVAALSKKRPASSLLLNARKDVRKAKLEVAQLKQQLQQLRDQMEGQKQTAKAAQVERSQDQDAKVSVLNWKSADFVWLGISFAMLIIGIGVGVWWIKEVHRRKMGGMHIRISGM